jgi:hypothetical protein
MRDSVQIGTPRHDLSIDGTGAFCILTRFPIG